MTGVTKLEVGTSEQLFCSFQIGLANGVVPSGQSLQAAIELAKKIVAFPHQCNCEGRQTLAFGPTYSRNSHL